MTKATMIYEKDPLASSGSLSIRLEGIEFEDELDTHSFLDALHAAGEHWIITCSCGEPGCAGIWEPVTVTHAQDSNLITWHFETKFYKYQGNLPTDEKGIARLTLDREQVLESVKTAVLAMINDTTCQKVYGLPFEVSKDSYFEHPLVQNLLKLYPIEDEVSKAITAGAEEASYNNNETLP